MIPYVWLVAIWLLSPVTWAADAADFFHQSLGDLSEELEIAQEEDKRAVLLFFEMDECPYCAYMKANVLNRDKVQAYFKERFQIIPVDVEGDISITDFEGNELTQKEFAEKKHRVRATPVFAFFDLEGRMVTKFTGKTSSVEEFLLLGEYVADKQYLKTSFNRYKRAKLRRSREP